MLKALYDYGIRNGLSNAPGFVPKAIRAYIVLAENGDFLGIEQCGKEETQLCPDIGSLANSPDKCNPLAEKAEIVLAKPPDAADGENDPKALKKQSNNLVKQRFFQEMLASSARFSPTHAVCLKALETPEIFSAMCVEAKLRRLKPADRISFRVGGVPITEDPGVGGWWTDFRRQFSKTDGADGRSLCLITGEATVPLATLPKINGLQTVGGHSSGEALFCFDKAAFSSYGLRQSANAPVSEEAFAVIKAALDDLLRGAPAMYKRDKSRDFTPAAPVFAGMKFVHWFDRQLEPEDDEFLNTFGDSGLPEEEDDGEEDADAAPDETAGQHDTSDLRHARREADELVKSAQSGDKGIVQSMEKGGTLPSEYHILLISGANGRAMVRRYEHGSYEALRKNLALWYADLALCDSLGTETIRPQKLKTRLFRLMPIQESDKKPLERMKKELAGLTPSIILSILNGTPLPDAAAVRALAYIRSKMLKPNENSRFDYMPDGIACQWLKVWLIRKGRTRNEEVSLVANYDKDFPSAAYHCGAITAIYADIQRRAMPDVNTGVIQRYYGSASTTPALVLGTLAKLSTHHLDKIANKWLVQRYEQYLNEAYAFFGTDGVRTLPRTLNLEGQSYFAIGYRQMSAQLNADRAEAAARKKADQKEQEDT